MASSSDSPPQQLPMRRRIFVSSIIALVLIVIITVVVVTKTAIAQEIGPDGLFALLLFGGVALTASLATTEVIPWGARTLEHWLQPKVLSAVAMAMILTTGTLFSLIPLLEKTRDAKAAQAETDSKLGNIADGVSAGRAGIDSLNNHLGVGQPSLIARHINGIWGEAGTDTDPPCGVTYGFTLGETALSIDKLSNVATGRSNNHYVYTRNGDNDIVVPSGARQSRLMTEATTRSLVEEGIATNFTLESNGKPLLDRLTWEHRGGGILPIKLVRCSTRGVNP